MKSPGNTGARSQLSASFAAGTPVAIKHAARSVPAISTLSALEKRSSEIKERALLHYKNFEHRWVAKEAIRIWQRQLSQSATHPAPKGATSSVNADAIMRMASRNVLARTHQRLARINSIKTRMGNAIVRNMAPPSPRRAFNEVAPKERSQKQILKR